MKKSQAFRKSHRYRRKKSIFRNRYFWIFVLSLIAAGALFHFLVFGDIFQIKEIQIFGNRKVSTEDLQNVIQNQIEKKILFFSSKSIFLANSSEIKNTILKEFPLVGEVNFKKKLPNLLEVKIEERNPVAVFSQDYSPPATLPAGARTGGAPENYFFIDKEGVIFEKIPTTDFPMLKIKSSIAKEDLKSGEKAIPKEELSQILEVKSKLQNDLRILVKEVSIISEERLNAKTSENWEIYLNLAENLDWQLQKLALVLEQKIPPEKREELEYIDLRFGDRAYYKYHD